MNTNDKPIGAKMTTKIRRIVTGHDKMLRLSLFDSICLELIELANKARHPWMDVQCFI